MDRLRYLLGILTLAVMVAGAWFLFHFLGSTNPARFFQVEVSFRNARGLKTGADLRYRGIQVGSVRRIDVNDQGDQAIVSLSVEPGKQRLVRDNSRFWIVTPRFHGLTDGMSGLDTLVRDTYVAFVTPEPFGPQLADDSQVTGDESPAAAPRDVSLPAIARDDLLMQVLLPENHGVSVGAAVMFRGMPTGEVRGIVLAASGTHVEVEIRIAAAYRSTVTDASRFWVAQPRLNLNLSFSNPVSLDELSALITPYIAYYTVPKTGLPVPDGYRVAAALQRPEFEIGEVPAAALKPPAASARTAEDGPVCVVRVVYEAVDVDYLTPNDQIHREGTGVLYIDAGKRPLVLTTRSTCEADFFYKETFGAKIEAEKFVVLLPNGRSFHASRVWCATGDVDLAVLTVEGLPAKVSTTDGPIFRFDPPPEAAAPALLVHCSGDRGVLRQPLPIDAGGVTLTDCRGGAILDAGQLVGVLGQRSANDTKAVPVPLAELPEELRPGR